MYIDILETDYNFVERLVFRLAITEEEAQSIAREYYEKHRPRLIRTFWRCVRTQMDISFYEPEQDVILHGIRELIKQKVYLNGFNLAAEVERILVEQLEAGQLPMVDADMLGSALTKLSRMQPENREKLLKEIVTRGN